jgi:hypothetical protein
LNFGRQWPHIEAGTHEQWNQYDPCRAFENGRPRRG